MKRKRKSHTRIRISIIIIAIILPSALAIWTAKAETCAHYTPDYAKTDLLPILQKKTPSSADYEILLQQTGLARPGVEELYESSQQWKLLGLQDRFYAAAEVECRRDNLLARSERLTNFRELVYDGNPPQLQVASAGMTEAGTLSEFYFMPTVQTGDILITFNGHVFGWRSGHAAIVVDAEKRLTLEAIMPGFDSEICSLDDWQEYPGFALLRLKGASLEEREQIAAYAQKYLTGLPYSLTAFADSGGEGLRAVRRDSAGGAFPDADEKGSGDSADCPPPLSGTQCAHLVWYAYRQFGYDLDSDGGLIVTPYDLYRSDLLELVQLYGLNHD